MEKKCGNCGEDVTGIEPAICGLCSAFYHVGRECSGVSRTDMNNLFSKGAAIWICPPCRPNLDGSSVRNALKTQAVCSCSDLQSQIAQLTQLVHELASKVESHCSRPANVNQGSEPSGGVIPKEVNGNGNGSKRRYGNDRVSAPPPMKGTKTIDTCNLIVGNVIPEPKFWLYLTGFRPLVSNEAVEKFVQNALDYTDEVNVVKLVTKDADLSRFSFVSFKVGLHPELKERALSPTSWPSGVGFREFEESGSKNL